MTIAPASCAACGAPFRKQRQAQTTCSKACKQALFRKKGNAQCLDTSDTAIAAEPPPIPTEWGEYTRIWGPNKLLDIELRMLRLEPTGLRLKGGAMLYRRSAMSFRIAGPVQAVHTRSRVD
jgi:hypothetical protein